MNRIAQSKYVANIMLTAGFGYWMGTYGKVATSDLWNRKKLQYPSWYTRHAEARARWMGKRVLDCIGIDKWARWLDSNGEPVYDRATDHNQERLFSNAKELGMVWGPISEVPDVPGVCVWKQGHIGFVLGNGIARESHGGVRGVIDRPISDGGWTHYFYNPYVNYEAETKNYRVICRALNVRTGPGTTFNILRAVYTNEILRVTEIRGNWGKHQYGWSHLGTQYCVLAGDEQATYVVTCSVLNVRSGPGTSNKIIDVVRKGDVLHVVELAGDWGRHSLGWSHVGLAYCKPVAAQDTKPVEDYSTWPVLRLGQSNEYVKRMQVNLIMQGYDIPAGPTGNYLAQTEQAVLAFLKDKGLISSRTTSAQNIAWGQRCWKALLG